MTTGLDILDTSIKIGLGAAISGIATFLVMKRSHRHELNKLKLQDSTQLLREALSRFERAGNLITVTERQLFERKYKGLILDHMNISDCVSNLTNAFGEVAEASPICMLLGHKNAGELMLKFAQLISDLVQYYSQPHENWKVEEVDKHGDERSKIGKAIIDELAAAYQSTYA